MAPRGARVSKAALVPTGQMPGAPRTWTDTSLGPQLPPQPPSSSSSSKVAPAGRTACGDQATFGLEAHRIWDRARGSPVDLRSRCRGRCWAARPLGHPAEPGFPVSGRQSCEAPEIVLEEELAAAGSRRVCGPSGPRVRLPGRVWRKAAAGFFFRSRSKGLGNRRPEGGGGGTWSTPWPHRNQVVAMGTRGRF